MDLIDKITEILNEIGLKAPIIDIHYDNQGNVIGHVADESFCTKNDKEIQELIWNALKKNLDTPELIRVIAIFNETPQERIERLNGFRSRQIKHSNFWVHKTPDLTTYWLFIDVAKFEEDYKSFFLIINEKNKINKGLTFVYNNEVLSFMELEQDEIYDELYTNTFTNAEAEIKMDLMNHYEELTKQQLWGRANMYYYVYENFHLTPVSKNQLLFTEREIAQINEGLKHLDNFEIKKELLTAIKKSEIINKLKVQISYS